MYFIKRSIFSGVIVLYLIFSVYLIGAQPQLVLKDSLKIGVGESFSVDKFQNIYLVKKHELLKFDKAGKLLNRFSQNLLGNIDKIDVTNPLEIIVFYKEQSRILFLDNTLSAQGDPISFNELGYDYVADVCNSQYKGFWIYDANNFELIKLNKTSTPQNNSGNVNWLLKKEVVIDHIMERSNIVFASDTGKGVLMFDNLGNYMKFIPLSNFTLLSASMDQIIYLKDNVIHKYNVKTYENSEWKLDHLGSINRNQVQVVNDVLYLKRHATLKRFSLMD